jgi:putative membrane protein
MRIKEEASMRTTIFIGVAAAALALTACEKPGGQADQTNKPVNVAQDSAGAATGLASAAVGSLSAGAFVNGAAIGDMYEIEAAKIALKRSQSAEVKNLAQMILTDHTAASEKLKSLVSSGQVKETLPTEMDERRKGMIDNLNGSGGTDFDGRYIKQQIAAHHEAWTMMNGYKTAGQDEALKAFAAEVEPKIQMHLDMAQKMGGEAAGHTGTDTAPPAKPAG